MDVLGADVLGLELVMDQGRIATFAAPGDRAQQLSLVSGDATAPVVADVSVEVDDVDAAHAAAQARGAGGLRAVRHRVDRGGDALGGRCVWGGTHAWGR